MTKLIKENCLTVSIYDLKDWGLLDLISYQGTITSYTYSGQKLNSVGFFINLVPLTGNYIELTHISGDSEENQAVVNTTRYPIIKTQCNYGGARYWFICSTSVNGRYCGRKVAKLYLPKGYKYFARRHCYNLTYRSRIDDYVYCNEKLRITVRKSGNGITKVNRQKNINAT